MSKPDVKCTADEVVDSIGKLARLLNYELRYMTGKQGEFCGILLAPTAIINTFFLNEEDTKKKGKKHGKTSGWNPDKDLN